MKRTGLFYIWRLAWPLLFFEAIGTAVSMFAVWVLGLSVMKATFLSSLVSIPIYGSIYRNDRKRKAMESLLPVGPYEMIWAVAGTAALAYLSSEALSFSPLVYWSENYQEVNQSILSESIWIQLLTAVAVAPVAEELLFRGVLYGRLRERLDAKWAILCSALLFGIFHGNLVQGIHGFVVGLMLAWLMECFRDIRVTILGHMAANLSNILIIGSDELIHYLMEILICIFCLIRSVQIINSRKY